MEKSVINKRISDILYAGMAGYKPKVPLRLDKLEDIARKYIPKGPFAYISGGAGREDIAQKNHEDFLKWAIVPKMLTDVSEYDTTTVLFGKKHNYPFILSPVGAIDLANKAAEPAVGRAHLWNGFGHDV
jgi:lactate 2-monooxygenase